MTFVNPAAFYLLLASLLILALHLLRARERRREVSALSLWEGLPGEPQSRAARLRQQVDPLLLLQLAVLLVLVAALAQPAWRTRIDSPAGLAIVLDGSASMRTVTEDGLTRYEHAVEKAHALLDEYRSASTAVVQFSSQPRVLAAPEIDRSDLSDLLDRSEPTWYGDGDMAALQSLLASLGSTSQFEDVVLLTDHVVPDLPEPFDTVLVDGGDNLALTAFAVRENPDGRGVTALVSALNGTDAYQEATIRIDDRENQTTLSILMPPGSVERFLIPFPGSRGTLFTASLQPADGFAADNRRFFSLDRAIDVRVLWLGSENRYLLAALESVAPVTLVDAAEDADLTVVHDARAPASVTGTILLVHAGIEGLVVQGEPTPTERIDVLIADHPLLADVDPANFRIREAPMSTLPASTDVLLSSGELPLLAVYRDTARIVTYLAPDVLDTNLPITVDFPLLIRNLVAGLVRIPAALSYRSTEVGEPIPLVGRGVVTALYDADETPIDLPEGLTTFRPDSPGFHTLVTDRGAFALAVNVPTGESTLPTSLEPTGQVDRAVAGTVHNVALWPGVAVLAIVLLLAEAYLYAWRRNLLRRTR